MGEVTLQSRAGITSGGHETNEIIPLADGLATQKSTATSFARMSGQGT